MEEGLINLQEDNTNKEERTRQNLMEENLDLTAKSDDDDEIMVISSQQKTTTKNHDISLNEDQIIVDLNVGGKRFSTLKSTLQTNESQRFFEHLDEFPLDHSRAYFIDRNPVYFSIVLDYLRSIRDMDQYFVIPSQVDLERLKAEAAYFKLFDLVDLIDRKITQLGEYNRIPFFQDSVKNFEYFFQFIQQKGREYNWKSWLLLLEIFMATLAILTYDNSQEILPTISKSHQQEAAAIVFEEEITLSPAAELLNSTIIQTKAQLDQFLPLCNLKSPSELKLIYQASKHGFSSAQFHSRCDHTWPTLTLVKSSDGFVFGGYTEAEWTSDQRLGYKTDSNAFLFTLVDNSPRKLPVKGRGYETYAIFTHPMNGPTFGDAFENSIYIDYADFDLFLSDAANSNRLSYTKIDGMSASQAPYYFTALEIEVYQKLFL